LEFELHNNVISINDLEGIIKGYPYEVVSYGSILELSDGGYSWNTDLNSDSQPVYGYELVRKYHPSNWRWHIKEFIILPVDVVEENFIKV